MNFFRSEEHLGRRSQFRSNTEDSIISVSDAAMVQGTESCRHFGYYNYLSQRLAAAQRRTLGSTVAD